MLTFANPAGFWLALGLLPVLLFYFLRLRFRHQPIGSAFIWNRLAQQRTAGHRILWKSIFLLILQIAAVLVFTAAAAEPRWISQGGNKPGYIFLIDSSASMRCRNGDSTRFDQAVAALGKELAALPPDSLVAVFLADTDLRPVESAKGKLWRASEQAGLLSRARQLSASWKGFDEGNVAHALQAWLADKAPGWQAMLLSDGGSDLDGSKIQQALQGKLAFKLIGQAAHDLGIGMAWLPQAGGDQIVCTINNQNARSKSVSLRISSGNQVYAELPLVPPLGWSRQTIQLAHPLLSGAYKINLIYGDPASAAEPDDFPADDSYDLAVTPPRVVNVLHVGEANPFLRAAFAGAGYNFISINAWPANLNPGDWDLIINENPTVPAGLQANLLSFASGPPDAPVEPGLPIYGTLETTAVIHPLNRFVDWGQAKVRLGSSLLPGPETQILATCAQMPMIVTWNRSGYSQTIVGCSLQDSAIGLSGAFPVFLRNLVQICVPQSEDTLADSLRAGETRLRSEASDWQSQDPALSVRRVNANLLRIGSDQPGIHGGSGSGGATFIAVRIPESEMNLALRQLPGLPDRMAAVIETSQTNPAEHSTVLAQSAGQDLRYLALLLAMVLLASEWWLWQGAAGRRN